MRTNSIFNQQTILLVILLMRISPVYNLPTDRDTNDGLNLIKKPLRIIYSGGLPNIPQNIALNLQPSISYDFSQAATLKVRYSYVRKLIKSNQYLTFQDTCKVVQSRLARSLSISYSERLEGRINSLSLSSQVQYENGYNYIPVYNNRTKVIEILDTSVYKKKNSRQILTSEFEGSRNSSSLSVIKDLKQRIMTAGSNQVIAYSQDDLSIFEVIDVTGFTLKIKNRRVIDINYISEIKGLNINNQNSKIIYHSGVVYLLIRKNCVYKIDISNNDKQPSFERASAPEIQDFALMNNSNRDETLLFILIDKEGRLLKYQSWEDLSSETESARPEVIPTERLIHSFENSGFSNFIVSSQKIIYQKGTNTSFHIDSPKQMISKIDYFYLEIDSSSNINLHPIPEVIHIFKDNNTQPIKQFIESERYIYYIHSKEKESYVDIYLKGSELGANVMHHHIPSKILGISSMYMTDYSLTQIIFERYHSHRNHTILEHMNVKMSASIIYCSSTFNTKDEILKVKSADMDIEILIKASEMVQQQNDQGEIRYIYLLIIIIAIVGVIGLCTIKKMRNIAVKKNK